jgi:hypothetical protein
MKLFNWLKIFSKNKNKKPRDEKYIIALCDPHIIVFNELFNILGSNKK